MLRLVIKKKKQEIEFYMNKLLLLLIIALTTLFLAACEGKKSLDGYPMDKPPPSAYGPRDSEPSLDKADDK